MTADPAEDADADDEAVLEGAMDAQAEYLVTGDSSHLPSGVWPPPPVVSPRESIDAEWVHS